MTCALKCLSLLKTRGAFSLPVLARIHEPWTTNIGTFVFSSPLLFFYAFCVKLFIKKKKDRIQVFFSCRMVGHAFFPFGSLRFLT